MSSRDWIARGNNIKKKKLMEYEQNDLFDNDLNLKGVNS
jgi:hypothetical protein